MDKTEMETRFEMSDKLEKVIEASEQGEIALPEFLERVEQILKDGEKVLKELESK